MMKLTAAFAAIPLMALASVASAGEPLQLSNAQMDTVTAGSVSAVALLLSAAASGTPNAFTNTTGLASIIQTPVVIMTPLGPFTLSQGTVMGSASSTSSN